MSFARRCFGASSALLLLTFLAGCSSSSSSGSGGGSGTTTTPPALASGGASSVYAVQGTTPGSILAFSTSGTGTVTPTSTLTMPSGFTLYTVAVDRNSGTLYAGGAINTVGGSVAGNPEILAYTSGSTTPSRTILNTYTSGGSTLTGFDGPSVMTVDNSGNLYVMSDLASVAVYASNATGSVAPLRILSGAATLLNTTPLGMAVDNTGNLYVSTVNAGATYTGQIYEYSSTANGNVAPVNKLTSSSQFFYGIAVDTGSNLYAISESAGASVTSHSPTINEYSVTSSAITQTKSISSTSAFVYLLGLQVDSAGNMFTLNQNSSSSYSILGFGPTQTGSTTPAFQVTSTSLTASTSAGIAVH